MYKIYTIYKEGAGFCCFSYFCWDYFLTDRPGGSGRSLAALPVSLGLCCAAVVATATPSHKYGSQCRTKMGPAFRQHRPL